MSTVAGQQTGIGQPPEEVHLTNWPLLDDAFRAWPVAAGVVLAGVAAGLLSQSVVMGLASFAALTGAFWRMWIPVTFELGHKGILQSVLGRQRRIPWKTIARYEIHRRGVALLPADDATVLSPLRSLYLSWGSHREELLAVVQYYVIPRQP